MKKQRSSNKRRKNTGSGLTGAEDMHNCETFNSVKKITMPNGGSLPIKTVERLILYKRLLGDLEKEGVKTIYSHELAALANNTPVQVRRDLMEAGYSGRSRKGYDIPAMTQCFNRVLEPKEVRKVALVGIGNLGRAVLAYFSAQLKNYEVVAAFDEDEEKINRVIAGCKCYSVHEMNDKIRELKIALAILSVPADVAQKTALQLCTAGIRGILNFAPVPLRVPDNVFVGKIDITMELEKIAFFSGNH